MWAVPNPGSRAPNPARPRVLFVDDNLTQLDLYTFVLHHDLEVLTATRGEQAYAIACAQRPDALVVDCVMPDIHGLDLYERIVSNPATRTIPLIILTGDEASYARAHGAQRRRGADEAVSGRRPAARDRASDFGPRGSIERIDRDKIPSKGIRTVAHQQHTPEEERRIREASLDETIEDTFPASDPLSTDPNPDADEALERHEERDRKDAQRRDR
jgi:CheY-like chemotaxis protein